MGVFGLGYCSHYVTGWTGGGNGPGTFGLWCTGGDRRPRADPPVDGPGEDFSPGGTLLPTERKGPAAKRLHRQEKEGHHALRKPTGTASRAKRDDGYSRERATAQGWLGTLPGGNPRDSVGSGTGCGNQHGPGQWGNLLHGPSAVRPGQCHPETQK